MTCYAPPEGSYEDSHAYGLMSGALNLVRSSARSGSRNFQGKIGWWDADLQDSILAARPWHDCRRTDAFRTRARGAEPATEETH